MFYIASGCDSDAPHCDQSLEDGCNSLDSESESNLSEYVQVAIM